jgi:hypothetical protein
MRASSRAPRARLALRLAAILAIAGGPGAPATGTDLPLPGRLSETGLYAGDGSIAPGNLHFVPQYPLWSDGAAKSRWIHLPPKATIDVSDVDVWRFPVGTRIWKEFAWEGDRVETRLMWLARPDEWVFATYAWSEDQSDALLVPQAGMPDHVEIAPGKRHSIPSVADCETCHHASSNVVLGFGALQLSDDRDPLAPHAEPLTPGAVTLRSLVESGRLDPPRPELVTSPPRIRERDPVARAAIGYLSTNCGSCHNATGALARLGLDLSHDVAGATDSPEPAVRTTIDIAGRWLVPGIDADSSRVVAPGIPERSALFYRMLSRRPSSQMPPLGTVIPDEEAVQLVARWITSPALGIPPRAEP